MTDSAPERIHALLMDLIRAAGLLQFEQQVPGLGVSLSQGLALHELDTESPISQRELGQRLGLEKSTVSRMVADMERKELLVRERAPDNRRLYQLRLTQRGRELHERIAHQFHAHYVRWTEAMNQRERDALLLGLPALVRAIRADAPPWHAAPSEHGHGHHHPHLEQHSHRPPRRDEPRGRREATDSAEDGRRPGEAAGP
ncbi:MarR family winged helix-turn-helix transcriptional regulator [Salinactinospora qingdaonensis]|uniref:HTH marR-type domain-containing protein n=1 Tax=Salinactinospora qingdaonensis TaxID=702744 RepID=A0ABP7F8T3_9ACTN